MIETALIDGTYTIQLPNKTLEDVNIFDYNLNHACNGYVQCNSGGFIKARLCKVMQSNREQSA